MIDLRGLTIEQIKDFVVDMGEKSFRGVQIFEGIYKGALDIDDFTTLSKSFREKLKEVAYISKISIYKKYKSSQDGTIKYLIELDDGNIIETVLMSYKHGYSICISSQVGCRMGCKFCASTIDGLERNLTAGEILGQIMIVSKDQNIRIKNIVIMGSGEPLDNMKEIEQFFKIVHEEKGLNKGYRCITLSTCGIVPNIYRLADIDIPINLAISLHQWNQDKRVEIMPISKTYNVNEVIKAAQDYYKKTGRRVTYEYALIAGVNDSECDAKELVKLLGKTDCHVNIIPVNEIKENTLKKPTKENVKRFCKFLEMGRIKTTVRRELGQDISGACGQLRRSMKVN